MMVANLDLFVRDQNSKTKDVKSGRRSHEREKLDQQRRMRGGLLFLERMEADSDVKRAKRMVSRMRENPQHAKMLDKAVMNMCPPAETQGPRVATHDRRGMYEGHDRQAQWAPLECY